MYTIFAVATARGKSGVSVVRISGASATRAAKWLSGPLPAARRLALRDITDGNGRLLDRGLVVWFPSGSSFTGEDVVELHLHGSPSIQRALLVALSGMPDLRMAEPGEFTRRALENERLDLAQVEGLGDLIEAETEGQRLQAMQVFTGKLGQKVETWRGRLIRAAALLEATIDFADEDVPLDVGPEVLENMDAVLSDLRAEIAGSHIAERIRDGFEVAIVGRPNAGKSTLLNALAGRDAAITSEVAGTTRDVIEVRMDLRGLPVTVLDTAGLREARDEVEGIGIRRAIERASQADLRVFLLDQAGLSEEVDHQPGDIVVRGKGDKYQGDDPSVSGTTGAGIENLTNQIAAVLEKRASGVKTATHERHRAAMSWAVRGLESARNEVLRGSDRTELAAEELRHAIGALDSLVGRIDVEHLLDEIFASFCLGK